MDFINATRRVSRERIARRETRTRSRHHDETMRPAIRFTAVSKSYFFPILDTQVAQHFTPARSLRGSA
eukprot:2013791-Prymnesium_polylepis.1